VKIVDYCTVYSNDDGAIEDIDTKVKRRIEQGWQPVGGVCTVSYKGAAEYWQTMVKYEEHQQPTNAESRMRQLLSEFLGAYEDETSVIEALEFAHRRGHATLDSQRRVHGNTGLVRMLIVELAKLGVTAAK
jgi:hypothetical protein